MDEAQAELTRRWLTKAAHDLQNARLVASAPAANPPRDTGMYHCQQAAEKSVKAFFIFRDEPFAKTHEIEPLITRAAQSEPRFAEFAASAAFLSPFAWQFRYPSELSSNERNAEEMIEAYLIAAREASWPIPEPKGRLAFP